MERVRRNRGRQKQTVGGEGREAAARRDGGGRLGVRKKQIEIQ